MKTQELIEMAPMFLRSGRSLAQQAQGWMDSHPEEMAAIQHFWDDGDKQRVYNYFKHVIKEEDLLDAVIDEMFNTPERLKSL